MPRDRMKDLLRIMNEESVPEQTVEHITVQISSNESVQAQPSELTHLFEQIASLRNSVNALDQHIQGVGQLQTDLLMPGGGNSQRAKEELEEAREKVKRLSLSIQKLVKELEDVLNHDQERGSANHRIRMYQVNSLKQTYLGLMTKYNEMQNDFRRKLTDTMKRQLEITGKEATDDEIESMLERGDASVFADDYWSRTEEARKNLDDIKSRHDDLLRLEKSIIELRDLFVDIALLIESQGELIDNIEFNVEQTKNHVQQAQVQLVEAQKFQSKARRKKICIIGIVVVILVIIALIITISVVTKK